MVSATELIKLRKGFAVAGLISQTSARLAALRGNRMSRYDPTASGVGGGGDSPLHAIAEDDSRLDSTAGFLFDGSAALDAEACMALLQSFFNAADVDGENTVTVALTVGL